MSTWINVARYHLTQRLNYVVLPWAVLAFAFVVDVVILELIPSGHSAQRYVGGLGAIFVLFFVLGLQSVAKSLPFGLTLGISRRSYYSGTALLAVVLAAIGGLAISIGQIIERSSNGWGLRMAFFRVPYILEGSWFLTWLTSSVALALLFVYGMWFGLVFRRWNVIGTVAFVAAQITALLGGALAATWSHGWPSIGHFFTTISAAGLTGVLAAVAAVLLTGGFATLRRVTI